MSPQPSSFVGYIENYGIKLWRSFKQQYSMGRNGHRPKWLMVMVMGGNGHGPIRLWAEINRNLYTRGPMVL